MLYNCQYEPHPAQLHMLTQNDVQQSLSASTLSGAGRPKYPLAMAAASDNLVFELAGWRTTTGLLLRKPIVSALQLTPTVAKCVPKLYNSPFFFRYSPFFSPNYNLASASQTGSLCRRAKVCAVIMPFSTLRMHVHVFLPVTPHHSESKT